MAQANTLVQPLRLTEDEIDDLLYLARANETQDLPAYLAELSQTRPGSSHADVLVSAVDAASGNSALHYAAANGHTEILDVLRTTLTSAAATSSSPSAYKPFVNLKNVSGNTPLHWAALNGHLAAVKALIALGANAALLNAAGHDAVFEAEQNGKDDVVGWLLVEGGALDTVVGALRDEQLATTGSSSNSSSKNAGDKGEDDDEGEDVEMRISMGDTTNETGVETGVENLRVEDDAGKAKERASG